MSAPINKPPDDVTKHIRERGRKERSELRLNAQLQQQLQEQRKLVRERMLAQNAAVVSATQNQRVQSKLAVISANAQADAVRAQERLQLLQARSQLRQSQLRQSRGPTQANQLRGGLRAGAQVAGRDTWVDKLTGGIGDRVTRMPTPGGLFALFMILLIFIFIIIPVSATGQTRFELFWLTLLGRTHLDTVPKAGSDGGASGGSSGGSGGFSAEKSAAKSAAIAQDGFGNDLNAVQVSQLTALPQVPFGLPGLPSGSTNGARHG